MPKTRGLLDKLEESQFKTAYVLGYYRGRFDAEEVEDLTFNEIREMGRMRFYEKIVAQTIESKEI